MLISELYVIYFSRAFFFFLLTVTFPFSQPLFSFLAGAVGLRCSRSAGVGGFGSADGIGCCSSRRLLGSPELRGRGVEGRDESGVCGWRGESESSQGDGRASRVVQQLPQRRGCRVELRPVSERASGGGRISRACGHTPGKSGSCRVGNSVHNPGR